MADAWHHAVSSARKWGGRPEDYHHLHAWFDESKHHFGDFRHRAVRHHTEGIAELVAFYGPKLITSEGGRSRFAGSVNSTCWKISVPAHAGNVAERDPTRRLDAGGGTAVEQGIGGGIVSEQTESERYTKDDLARVCRERGYAKIVAGFSGGNDEGASTPSTATGPTAPTEAINGNRYNPKEIWDRATGSMIPNPAYREPTPRDREDDAIYAAMEGPVHAEYHSFAGDFYVSGTVVYDREDDTLTMSGAEEVKHDVPFAHVF